MERQMDALGRIVLPAGYRKQKNLQAGDVLCVDEQEGKRMIYPRKARCALCGGKKSFFPMGDILYVKPVGKYSLQGTTQGRYLTGGVPLVRFSM